MKIAIAGYGVEGQSNYRYFQNLGHDVVIVDENKTLNESLPEDMSTILGDGVFSRLDDFDMVVRTAGLAPKKITTNGKIWSATNEFFARCPAPIVGVTGTKGKGTTSSFIASILTEAGYAVHLVGNIGKPALDILENIVPEDIVVYELSSFQLWDLKKSPSTAVVLMIEPDHLDVHENIDDYIDAKSNIAKHQKSDDICIYHPTNKYAFDVVSNSAGRKRKYGIRDDGQVYVRENTFFVQDHAICGTENVVIPGVHNLENACAAISAALQFTDDNYAVARGLTLFTGLPHRLKYVTTVHGVDYYDDSIATTPGSAIAAIRAFEQPKIIILGGSDKGADYQELIQLCADTATKVICIGQLGPLLHNLCQKNGVESIITDGMMHEIIDIADDLSQPGDVVILSPASASFDQYKSYSDRGDKYITAVEELKHGE